jgi:hypothetical protein
MEVKNSLDNNNNNNNNNFNINLPIRNNNNNNNSNNIIGNKSHHNMGVQYLNSSNNNNNNNSQSSNNRTQNVDSPFHLYGAINSSNLHHTPIPPPALVGPSFTSNQSNPVNNQQNHSPMWGGAKNSTIPNSTESAKRC